MRNYFKKEAENFSFLNDISKIFEIPFKKTFAHILTGIILFSKVFSLTLTVTIFGCCALSSVLISRSDVIGKPSFSFSIFNRFNATISSTGQRQMESKY